MRRMTRSMPENVVDHRARRCAEPDHHRVRLVPAEVAVVGCMYHMYYTDRSVVPEVVRHRTWLTAHLVVSAVVLQSGGSGSWDDDGVVVSFVLVEGGVFRCGTQAAGTGGW